MATKEPCSKKFELTVLEKRQMGLYAGKTYGICLDPAKPNQGRIVVCPCNGCNERCKGYQTEEDTDVVQ